MADFYLTRAAKADLKDIGRYTEQKWGKSQRDSYLTMLDSCFQGLASRPLKGLDVSAIRQGYRKYSAGSHVVFYRQIAEDTIEIVRVLHGRMDPEQHLSEL